jgi:molybdate/tungstate transport system substrate-binding protein
LALATRSSLIALCLALSAAVARAQDSLAGPLIIVSAGSLRAPLADLLAEFVQQHPGVVPRQTSGGSVEVIRRSRDSGPPPDVLGSADYALIPAFLIPRYATSYVKIARNSMVLAYADRSRYASEVNARNWPDILLRPGVRTRRADPALDPGAYRVVLIYRLAERFFKRPGLAAQLEAAAPIWTPKPGEDPYAQLAAGDFDFLWTYKSQAVTRGLRFVALPRELNLGDSTLARWYAGASLKIAREIGGTDSIEIRGEPIEYGLTIPTAAPHRAVAEAFVALVRSEAGKEIFRRHGFVVP